MTPRILRALKAAARIAGALAAILLGGGVALMLEGSASVLTGVAALALLALILRAAARDGRDGE